MCAGAVSVLRWMNKKPVHLLTTSLDPRVMQNVVSRNNPNNARLKPAAVQDYILNMSGVDKSDQLMSYAPLHRKTMKWWKKVFFHLFTLSMLQASILHEKFHGRKMPLRQFVEYVGLGMNDKYFLCVAAEKEAAQQAAQQAANPPVPVPGADNVNAPLDAPAPPAAPAAVPAQGQAPARAPAPAAVPAPGPAQPRIPPTPQSRLVGASGHFPMPIGVCARGNDKKYRQCHVCTVRAKRKPTARLRKSSMQCAKCKITLCDKPYQPGANAITCFALFHTIKNYADYE